MRKFMRLCRNEWDKVFARPLIYLCFAAIFGIAFLQGLIVRGVYGNANDYYIGIEEFRADARKHTENYIATLEAEKRNLEEGGSNPGFEKDGLPGGIDVRIVEPVKGMGLLDITLSPTYYDRLIAYARRALEESIPSCDWRFEAYRLMANWEALIETGALTGDEAAAAREKIDKTESFVKKKDWRGFLNFVAAEQTELSDDDREAFGEENRIRFENGIEPVYTYGVTAPLRRPWKEDALETYRNTWVSLKSEFNENGAPMTEEDRKQIRNRLEVLEYQIKNDISTEPEPFTLYLTQTSALMSVIALCIVVLSATQVASEYTSGTVKLLLIAPHRRWKILLSKLAVMIAVSFLLMAVLLASGLIVGLILFGGSLNPYAIYLAGSVRRLPALAFVLIRYLLAYPELLVYTSLAVMLSVVLRHSAVAIGAGVALLFSGSIVAALLPFVNRDWTRFVLQANTNLGMYFPQFYPNEIFAMIQSKPLHPDMTFGFSLCVLAVYLICINTIAFDSFNRRDIK